MEALKELSDWGGKVKGIDGWDPLPLGGSCYSEDPLNSNFLFLWSFPTGIWIWKKDEEEHHKSPFRRMLKDTWKPCSIFQLSEIHSVLKLVERSSFAWGKSEFKSQNQQNFFMSVIHKFFDSFRKSTVLIMRHLLVIFQAMWNCRYT